MSTGSTLDRVADRMRGGGPIAVLTGAGVSAASGIPTFRGPDGLWKRHRPEELATPEAFARNPELVWEWYAWRRAQVAGCRPNRAHDVLADWSRRDTPFSLITQNVDGLHERAGARDVVRFHGSIWEMRCSAGCADAPERWSDDRVPLPDVPPRCPHCGQLARPAVVWFGEPIAPDVITRSLRATACEVFLTVGTSALVHPAAGLVQEARRQGAFTVEINLEPTPVSEMVDLAFHGPAEEILPRLDERLEGTGDLKT